MTEIKSVYEWKVVFINKSSLENLHMVVETNMGEENTALACAEKMTQLIAERCKNPDYVVSYANFEYIGDEL